MPPPDSTSKPLPVSLATLPYDILHAVVAHIPDARSLAALSQASRTLHGSLSGSGHGWQLFIQSHFASIYPTILPYGTSDAATEKINWRRYAEELTLLSRNYDRRAFLARSIEPDVLVPWHPGGGGGGGGGKPRGGRHHYQGRHERFTTEHGELRPWGSRPTRGRQTVGFHPVLDSYCSALFHTGGEVLAMGLGQELFIRKRVGGRRGKNERWWLYEDSTFWAGKDDITALKLFRGGGEMAEVERAVVGRANGSLACVGLGTDIENPRRVGHCRVETVLETQGVKVRAATVCGGEERLVASVLGNSRVALYSLPAAGEGQKRRVTPASELEMDDEEQPWSAQFLGAGMLAVGKKSTDPLTLYAVTPSGLQTSPIRSFSAESCTDSKTSSVQPIAPLPDIRRSGDVFIAGWYSGATLLHDLRCPDPYVSAFIDPLDSTSAIYSLLPIGRERILVGGARHNLLKTFDLRMPGGRAYYYPGSCPPSQELLVSSSLVDPTGPHIPPTPGWATYLTPYSLMSGNTSPWQPTHRQGMDRESPVYSLASGAPGGGRIFAGVEGRVWEFDFVGDMHGARTSCTMYEFVGRTQLWRQEGEELLGGEGPMGATGRLDGRWVDSREPSLSYGLEVLALGGRRR